ncbi:HAMP domain-containing histidine kinase [Streptomyces sp. RLB3-17]|uniref:sensor histidine kinase n=1 Tax=unclassified Streptomyces TaxID=2593676 RepID=UPI001162ED39|nr:MULTISPECIES: HAMP domain-containing sensor histidine kinase [unclassified Streptomyces]QDO00317.1 HAMP domain-containing histidine kinase [Streptomyces sp. RLB1-9]QDO22047.1 HAMP domain-containing histidine kinase [Streptomyces sp. S1A1-8]QDO32173.1 HAMP domain-containing histidine kinase [Streptomyces sp. S1A1-3]QDO42087.1 HAMP domain-containing histidine kinase [Streptomyces sp. RLB3-17]
MTPASPDPGAAAAQVEPSPRAEPASRTELALCAGIPAYVSVRRPRRHRGIHSLRGKLTLANVGLLALGIIVATAVSLMGMRHYLLDQVDTELSKTRESLTGSRLTLHQIDSLTALAFVRERMVPGADRSDKPDSIFAAVDGHGTPLSVGGFKPTDIQRALVTAVDDPSALAHDPALHDTTVHGASYRVTGARLADGTYVLLAASTDALHKGIAKALKLDLGVGTLLLSLLAVLTMISVSRRMRPLEDMVETSSAIAEGDLTRRVPSSHHPTQEVEQLRLALNSMLHQVESAYRTRERSAAQLRRFVADASHELRTPLSAIRGYLQLYEKGMLREPGERRRAWDRMNAEADRMGRLVDELLILARLDQSPELRFKNVDLSRLVRDAAEDLRAQQPGRPVTVGADGTLLVHADESGLRQVLGNLVANVRTHTPADVPVRLGLEREDGTVRLCVADQGPGLAEEDAARIFDRFFRAGGGAGSGLGMAIVQGVVAAHGGDVAVRTAPGAGLEVTVTLPTR